MPTHLHSESDLDAALAALIAADPRLAAVLAVAGRPPLRRHPGGFAGLARIIVGQQLSLASAGAIWGRLTAAYDPFEAGAVLRARRDRLARLGLSEAKVRSFKALAQAVERDGLDLAALADRPADDAHRALVAVHGIGAWTADSYLLFCLGHADAWPAGDLALQEAVRLAFGQERRPTAREMAGLAEAWRPWRGVAAFLLWSYYRAIKRRDPVPDQPTA
jgi:DNA-3-methyladenine glycosylase II